MSLPTIAAQGILFIGDPHVAATPPGQRAEGYRDQVLAKLAACLAHAREENLVAVILGDLFHWPRENPNGLLVELMSLFGRFTAPCRAFVLVGNHDKYQARFTDDVSLAVLRAAGSVTVLDEPGPAFVVDVRGHRALVGASPDMTPLPESFDREAARAADGDAENGPDTVLWIAHHNIGFPDYEEKPVRLREIPGVDWVVNGHIHRPQPTQTRGATRWANPGGLVRMAFCRANLERRPAAAEWRPGCAELARWEVPVLPFAEVFPDMELPDEAEDAPDRESLFLKGLERLAWRRTQEGMGLKQFLNENLEPDAASTRLILDLYEEITHGDRT
ncbi:MAG: metallophosphoesterase [Desulfovibrionaceae bacterium]|jgi:hypothetical protein|nr:metallophosphoesterase [Desulfovibrionaceae bacterium]